MENDLIIKAKELMINSSIGQYIGEEKIDEALNEVFSKHQNSRLIIATFASNIYRLKHIKYRDCTEY